MQPRLFAMSVALMLAGACTEAADRMVSVPCAEAGSLEFPAPDDWSVDIRRHDMRMPPTVTVTAPDGQAQWIITPVWKAADRNPPSTPAEIRTRVQRTAETVGAGAAPLRELPGGLYFDGASGITPEPFTRLRQGVFRVGELTVSFTAMSSDAHAADQDALVSRLGNAAHHPARP
ncbi:hypothetical protein [Methyloversatilis thermotolerans]|uniref:hypothetical protein n=1 Tax=Methyloversatilis thermotolerans TaxID=1346290 RepID=UPI00039B3327|nr:hypothetical protein [Methyloversatilis thermotolerans]